jgi:hypothetical protein
MPSEAMQRYCRGEQQQADDEASQLFAAESEAVGAAQEIPGQRCGNQRDARRNEQKTAQAREDYATPIMVCRRLSRSGGRAVHVICRATQR